MSDRAALQAAIDAEAAKIRCPNCRSVGVRRDTGANAEIIFPCGAYAIASAWEKHGAEALIDYNSACEYIVALRAAKSMIEQNHPWRVDYKGMLVGGGGRGSVEETYAAICDVLP